MSAIATPPNPCLIAILLVCTTRTGSGAQIVFHYPSNPFSNDNVRQTASSAPDETDDGSSTDSDDSVTDEDDLGGLHRASSRTPSQTHKSKVKSASEDEDVRSGFLPLQPHGPRKQTPDSLFGLAEDGLVSLLSPDRAWHKRKFELGVDDLIFVGRPVFARSNGTWRKSKRQRKEQQISYDEPGASDSATDNGDAAESESNLNSTSVSAAQKLDQGTKSPLTMFHVVFVMNPPPLEHTLRVKDMYDHVIKRFSRILKWEQTHNDYVWKQCEAISTAANSAGAKKLPPSSLSSEIQSESSLAAAIANIFTAISNSRIASVTLSPTVSVSLQIPPVTSTSYLPSLTDPPIQPGLWLTTATEVGFNAGDAEDSTPAGAMQLAKHYTLLLKSPPQRIAKDALEAGGPLAAHLPRFVSLLRPTKSFHKLSVASQISLSDIQILARHLIYWRRAVAIPPLHQKDVYIVSPNADMHKLREATKSYEQQFSPTMPNMPSLPKILSFLSGIPKPFGGLIPSTDHKEIYYLALAWLMRNGWVTQLRTFAYIRVDPTIKKAVAERDRVTQTRTQSYSKAQKDSQGSERNPEKGRQRPSITSHSSSDGKRSMDGNWSKNNAKMASLILSPPKASAEESKWLDFIEESLITDDNLGLKLSEEDRTELQQYWPSFVKYFNGHVALDSVPVREGLKRKFVWSLLGKVGLDLERGVEDENGMNKAILVPIRHW